jgi:hypothetical protein
MTALGILAFGAAPIAILGVLLWLCVFFCSHSFLLVLLWPAALLYQVIFPDQFVGQLSNSFTNLPILFLPMDPAYFFTTVYLIINAVTQPQKISRAVREDPLLCLFLVIVVASTIIYTPLYGKMAIGEARKFYFYFFFPLLTVISIKKPRDLRRLISAIFVVATCISVTGSVTFIMNPSRLRIPVSAEGSLILLFTIFSILAIHMNGMVIVNRSIDTFAVGMFLLNIIGSQHRTVYLGCSFGLFLMFWLYRKKATFLIKALIASIALLTVMIVVLGSTPKFTESFMKRTAGLTNPYADATGLWRIEAWHRLLDKASVEEFVYGKGLGSYYSWFYRGEKEFVQPHNAYVQLILKFGILGLIIYGLLVLRFFRKVFAVREKLPPGAMRAYVEMSILSFGSMHAFILGYGFSVIGLIFYAIGISTTKLLMDLESSSRVNRRSPAPLPGGACRTSGLST